ncbi:hypothetical protein BDQ12DRAFT_267695 [Crucibulum laeve]|uniref:Uncharacterized protein n=1 Tax=Crucibulum laeve TaxID=68775 RepID=A0A5C3LSH6_9AGAR|nr:hypothetical protein BDQ12DRAFT_267695 [Crucibulum laeve]
MTSFMAYSRFYKQSSKLISGVIGQAKCCGSLIHQRSVRRRVRPQISTFDPARLVPEDYFDLSSRIAPNIKISTAPTPLNPYYDVRNRAYLPYPPGTRGFYYFHSDPSLPAAAAQIRFRVTPSPDPASFSEGKDLLRPSTLPWSLQILGLASDPPKPMLKELVKQGLVNTPLLEQCMAFYAKEPLSQYSHIATSLDDPFLVQFPVTVITFNTLGFRRMGKFILPFEKRNSLGIHDNKRTPLLSG